MDQLLATKMLEKNLINEATEVLARYKGSSISGDNSVISTGIFSVHRITTNEDGTILLTVVSTRDGHRRVIRHQDILEIDGMDPRRLASVYNIKANGLDASVGKRRGRKPKDRSASAAV